MQFFHAQAGFSTGNAYESAMDSGWIEWVNVLFRFVHVLAAIMWIGNSLLFTWMELNLILLGELDMLHGGGVFHLEKRLMHSDSIPERLHWFKWQSYTTWMTGIVLLVALFYTNGSSLVDATRTDLSGAAAVGLSIAGLIGGWLVYDSIWRSPLGKKPLPALVLSLVLLFGIATSFGTIFNGRALYLQIGAMMGSYMSANVFFHIMGNQHKFMRALRAGQPHDLGLGKRAKERSLHNHYMTFPVLFMMLSAHFPRLHAAEWNVPILVVVVLTLMGVKHLMNSRYHFKPWLACIFGAVVAAGVLIGLFLHLPEARAAGSGASSVDPAIAAGKKVFETKGCAACHVQGSSQIAPTLHGIYGTSQELTDGSKILVDEAYLRQSILEPQAHLVKGFAAAMPSFKGVLNDTEIDQVIAYLKSIGSMAR
jgi:uncharacterized membrane protein